jgi:hypothetical protein
MSEIEILIILMENFKGRHWQPSQDVQACSNACSSAYPPKMFSTPEVVSELNGEISVCACGPRELWHKV